MPAGRPKNIKTPKDFLKLFNQFKAFKKKDVIFSYQLSKGGEIIPIPHIPPLTWAGFDTWLWHGDYIIDTRDYRDNTDDRYTEFKAVIRAISQEMYANKFEGAAVGVYNANIIARDLGLTEKTDNKTTVNKTINWGEGPEKDDVEEIIGDD